MRIKEIISESEWNPSQEEMINMARGFGIVVNDDPPEAGLKADAYHWTYEPAYPVSKIHPGPEAWADWMKEEIKMWGEEGEPNRYGDMFDRPIEEPIIIIEVDGKAWLWDGCHRTGAAAMRKLPTLPAIVGRLPQLTESIDPSIRFPKPSAIIPYSDEEDEAAIFSNPSAGTILKCIGQFDARAIMYDDGMLITWAAVDMYHRDVYDFLKRGRDFILLMLFPPKKFDVGVAVKGASEDAVPFSDEKWLSVLHNNRALTTLYGNDFGVVEENWW